MGLDIKIPKFKFPKFKLKEIDNVEDINMEKEKEKTEKSKRDKKSSTDTSGDICSRRSVCVLFRKLPDVRPYGISKRKPRQMCRFVS